MTLLIKKLVYDLYYMIDLLLFQENLAKMTVQAKDPSKTITRTTIYYYNLQCLFNQRLNVSTAGIKVVEDLKQFEVTSRTNFSATMDIFQSNLFSSLATPPIQVKHDQRIILSM